ncbi:CBS domain-containing protein [Phormidium sp. FACHB-592]|uniref:CBS domain-containing protein n=1 Tax=Stenomitos frigidus AS-A4 TaxID=2933935 RepID=A0ABV0KU29_9CYAN|nr:CBS domain-containing protein [Phormidium sp. FACHB-592]MBD2076798.1 CBS domain-containing protein [Phormidium sp. FACHB-592]
MDLILCHTTADFDTLGAAVGLSRLLPGSRIVLAGGAHAAVRDFLALHRDEYALIERRSVNPDQIRTIAVVDTQVRDRLGAVAEWLALPDITIAVYDHHLGMESDIAATQCHVEAVGATTTLMVEQLQAQQLTPTAAEATVMALGIHVDTGSLTFDQTTPRDARALAWLMEQGASLRAIAHYAEPGLAPALQPLLTTALHDLQTETVRGSTIGWIILTLDSFVPGLSSLASHLMQLTDVDALLLAAHYAKKAADHSPTNESSDKQRSEEQQADDQQAGDQRLEEYNERALTVIGRSHIDGTDLNALFQPIGGGGHPRAASVNLHQVNPEATLAQLVTQLKAQIPQPLTARVLMSSPVRTIRPETSIAEAQRLLIRYGHSGLSVVNEAGQLLGIISRRDLDLALHHGFSHAPVKGYMTTNLKTIAPDTSLPAIEALMVTYNIGRLPVLDQGNLVGIVTRTDVLRQLHRQDGERGRWREEGDKERGKRGDVEPLPSKLRSTLDEPKSLLAALRHCLKPELWQVLSAAAEEAEQQGWHLYLVGGAVRDLLLAIAKGTALQGGLLLEDVDLVVDGFHRAAVVGAGVALAKSLQTHYPTARLEIHGKFQTAALLWHRDPVLKSLWVDFATARTEFYPYPAANPEVESSSIQQDLYRRDFTINAMAIRLTEPCAGEILDFFGGLLDLQAKQIRVLHANSFIEDPTRIYRAVRFATRLGFQLDAQTESYIRYAIASGIYSQTQVQSQDQQRHHQSSQVPVATPALQTRLRAELKYIFQSPYWQPALQTLAELGALQCLHPTLAMDADLWRQLRWVDRGLKWLKRQKAEGNVVDSTGEAGANDVRRRQKAEATSNFHPSAFCAPLSSFPPSWLALLEVLLAHLAPEHRSAVATNLQLPIDSTERLQQLETAQLTLTAALPACQRPSEIVQLLKPYDLWLLVLIAVRSERSTPAPSKTGSPRRKIWQYLTHWVAVKPPLDGKDLKALGYKPGPQFKAILEALVAATLDGVLSNHAEAEAFVAERFGEG